MENYYTITVFTENTPGVLYRIADLFLRRKINIESLTVSEVKNEEQSRFTIVVHAEEALVEKIVKQLYKIIEVIKVIDNTDEELIIREISLIRVCAKNLESRKEIEQFTKFREAKIIEIRKDYMTIQIIGTEKQINSFYDLLKQFGIKEFIRSGRIVLFNN